MKKIFLLLSALAVAATTYAQSGSPCPGLKNPASFTSGSTSGVYVGYYSGQTGEKPHGSGNYQAPNALTGATGVTMTSAIIPASQLATITGNGGTSYCGSSLNPTNRFRIMSNTEGPGSGSQLGKDPLVSYNLPYCPTDFDPTINKSIRIGNCGTNYEAEALYYTMNVRIQNALLFIYYGIVVQAPGHGNDKDPAFVIRVTKKNSSNQFEQISDTLFYGVSSSGVSNGVNGWHSFTGGSGGTIFYRDWNKVAINLSKYLYEQVRIEMYIGDCAAGGHYGYCYVAGDCQPMSIGTSGCPAGATTTVQTLTAPTGLNNYVWYKCNSDGQYIANENNISSSVNWTRLTPTTSTNHVYDCQVEDFNVLEGEGAGTLTNNMIFMCEMTSAMDPDKPFISRLPVRVINTKPLMSIDTLKTCDGDLHLTNQSFVPNNTIGCDTSISKWWFYEGLDTNTAIADSAIGGKVTHRYDSSGFYAVKVRSFNYEDHECFSDSTYTIFSLGRPKTKIEASALEVCDSETVVLTDVTPGSVRRDWILYNDTSVAPDTIPVETILGDRHGGNSELRHIFGFYKNPVVLRAYNGLFTTDSINTYDTVWCTATDSVNIEVFQHPTLNVTGDTVVCNGQETDITVSTETPGCTYRWYRYINASNQIAEGPTLRVLPYDDTCKYYVKVISTKQCVAWDSVNAYRVNPTLSI